MGGGHGVGELRGDGEGLGDGGSSGETAARARGRRERDRGPGLRLYRRAGRWLGVREGAWGGVSASGTSAAAYGRRTPERELGDERGSAGLAGRGLARALGWPSRRRGERGEREQCWASAWHCSKSFF